MKQFKVYLTNPNQTISIADSFENGVSEGFKYLKNNADLKNTLTRYQRYWIEDNVTYCDFGSWERYLCIEEVEI